MWKWFKREKVNPVWQFVALITFIAMLVANVIAANTEWLGGLNTAAVSDGQPNLFAPAGYTFAIWGLIYLLLGVMFFRVFEIWRTRRPYLPNSEINKLLQLFTLSSLLNTGWIFAWQYQVFWLSVVLIVALLVTVAWAHSLTSSRKLSKYEDLALRKPFGVYFGWLTVATIANITTWLVSVDWRGGMLSEVTWTVIILIVGALIGLLTAVVRRDWVYMAVFVWAYGGILAKHMSSDGYGSVHVPVVITLSVLLPVLLAATVALAARVAPRFGRQ